MKELGEKLRAIREVLRLNQTELAERLGRQQRDISDMEMGKRKALPPEYISFLMEEGVDMNWVLGDTPLQNPDPYLQRYQQYRNAGESPPEMGLVPLLPMVPHTRLHEYPARRQDTTYLQQLDKLHLSDASLNGSGDVVRGFQLPDDSMQDTLAPYDWVIARRSTTPLPQLAPSYVYVVVTQHQVIIGRLAAFRNGFEGLRIVFDHDAYPPVQIEDAQIVEIWRAQAYHSGTVPGSRQSVNRHLESIYKSLETIRDRLPS